MNRRNGGPVNRRWRTALHEAGHALTNCLLRGARVRAVVYESGGGIAFPKGGDSAATFHEGVMLTAGMVAGRLAERTRPPRTASLARRRRTDASGRPSAADRRASARLKDMPTDSVQLLRLACATCSNVAEIISPLAWMRRAFAAARRFVKGHRAELIELAGRLYAAGRVSIKPPAGPAGRKEQYGRNESIGVETGKGRREAAGVHRGGMARGGA
ncbi:MAG: hypothetical protein ACE15C_08480 [Phycisphaerae bacterium]